MAPLLDGVGGEVFETVDDVPVDDDGVDACTKSLSEVEDEITGVLRVVFFDIDVGVSVVLLP